MITCEEKFKFIKSTNKLRSYIYHRCSKRKKGIKCTQKLIKHDDLKKQIIQYLNSITIPEEFLHWTLEVLRKNNEIEQTERDKVLKNLQKKYEKCIEKIDNLIQIGHNVHLGENTVIAAHAAIAGSAKIGKNCQISGCSGINGHITIADNVTVTAMSLVIKSIKD